MIEREEWEREAFDNLEEMCAQHGRVSPSAANEPPVERAASQRELAAGLRKMPVWDDDVWCPRLA
jgi:hypothetical protein